MDDIDGRPQAEYQSWGLAERAAGGGGGGFGGLGGGGFGGLGDSIGISGYGRPGGGVRPPVPQLQRRLLRARRERPGDRAAEQRDELAPSQVIELHSVARQPGPDCRISNCGGSVRR